MDGKISTKSIIVAARHQVSCELEGESAILNLKSGIYYGLKSLGTHIWSLIQEPRSVSEVRDAILKEYQVGRERCESDLLAVVEQLAAQGLIEVTNERPG